jgi:hypothetical protein
MARHTRSVNEYVDWAREKVKRLLASPLTAIAEKLGRDLDEGECACRAGSLSADKLGELCSYVSYIFNNLPRSFGERFYFDAVMIRATADDWGGSMALSGMVLPCYGQDWGHARLQMPSEGIERAHVIDLIVFPGEDRLEDVDLLSYPLLAHELGHYLYLKNDSSFAGPFTICLNKTVRSLRRSGIADRGAMRPKFQQVIEELTRCWTPSPDHGNWAHELAIDLTALWTCGPSYLACFEDSVRGKDPFRITQDHPPYAVRLDALVSCARELGFGNDCEGLGTLRAGWEATLKKEREANLFLALANRELIADCSRAALGLCKALRLTQCSTSRIETLRRTLKGELVAEPGADLLLKAWLYAKKGKTAYDSWQRATVQRIAKDVMQLSR